MPTNDSPLSIILNIFFILVLHTCTLLENTQIFPKTITEYFTKSTCYRNNVTKSNKQTNYGKLVIIDKTFFYLQKLFRNDQSETTGNNRLLKVTETQTAIVNG